MFLQKLKWDYWLLISCEGRKVGGQREGGVIPEPFLSVRLPAHGTLNVGLTVGGNEIIINIPKMPSIFKDITQDAFIHDHTVV